MMLARAPLGPASTITLSVPIIRVAAYSTPVLHPALSVQIILVAAYSRPVLHIAWQSCTALLMPTP
eukprot:35995-Rhodomonas_salina.1